jgi:cysteine synthase A
MIRTAEQDGRLQSGMTIVEPTSGNTGIALAMAAAALGYRLILTMPESMSEERRSVMASYGAELELTAAEDDMPGAIYRAEEIVATDPARYFMPQQFHNLANPEAHRRTTTHQLIHLAQLLFFALLVLSKLTQKKHLNGINLVKQKSFYQN